VDDKAIDFFAQIVGRHLKLPMDGLKLEDMFGLSKKQYEDMFERDFFRTSNGCPLEKVKHHFSGHKRR
jgi:hypothetical protein